MTLTATLVALAVALLPPFGPVGEVRRRRRDEAVPAPVEHPRGRHAAVAVGVATALAVLVVLPGWWSLAAGPAGLLAWRRAGRLETGAARRRRERIEAELPHVVDLVRSLVTAGAAPDRALRSVCGVVSAETAEELRPWAGRLLLGGDPASVWADLSRHPQLGRLGAALHRAAVGGAPVTDALRRLSEDLRAARRADLHRRVREVEVRATAPLGACLLPAFVLLGVVPLVAGAARGLVLG